MAAHVGKTIYRFGVYEADAGSGELRKGGVRLRLQNQPFQVLVVLLEQRGAVVTRDDLREKLWPSDTFVDFDHSLNTIINKLREVLSDSASSPRYIETLAKRGYRFVAPVENISEKIAEPPIDQPVPVAAGRNILTRAEDLPAAQPKHVQILLLLIQVMYLSFYVSALARMSVIEDLLQPHGLHQRWIVPLIMITAAIGIPVRLYLLSAVAFDSHHLGRKFLRIFPAVFVLDELWALAPFLLAPQIGFGLAFAVTAALLYLPFGQRSLVLMRERSRTVGL